MGKKFNLIGPIFNSTRESIVVAPELREGTKLDKRFVIIRKISKGSVCPVYLADDLVNYGRVAIKIANMSSTPAVTRLLHEKRVCDNIDDTSHVIKCYGLHQAEYENVRIMFLVKEYANQGSLEDWLIQYTDDHECRLIYALQVFKACAQAVISIHRQGIVCNDLSMANIVKVNNTWKVCDLGLANHHAKAILCQVKPEKWGTPVVMSPEAFNAKFLAELNERSDCYSMFVNLYQMLSPNAYPPFYAKTYDKIKDLHCSRRADSLRCVDGYLSKIIAKGLNKNPDDRYSDLEEVLDAIENENPEIIAYRHGHNCFENGRLKYDEGNYLEAEIELSKVPLNHEDFKQADILLKDMKIRYNAVESYISEMKGLLISQVQDRFLQAKKIFDVCRVTYPQHKELRVIDMRLNIKDNMITSLFESFKGALACGDLTDIGNVLGEMEQIDYWAEQTFLVRRTYLKIEDILEQLKGKLFMAERAHDYSRSIKIFEAYEKLLNDIFLNGLSNADDVKSKMLNHGGVLK